MKNIPLALRKVFSHHWYFAIWFIIAAFMFALLITLPVGRFDISAFYYQLTGLDALSLISFAFFSIVAGINLSMETFLIKKLRQEKVKAGGRGILSFFASFMAGIFGSGVCAFCLAVILSLVGAPIAILTFLLAYRWPVFGVSAVMLGGALYFTSKSIMAHPEECKTCQIKLG